jgi:large subunit ribosomal protein L22
MQVSATHKYLRIAPRKVRLVADLIKKKKVTEARGTLKYATRAAAAPLEKALRSAVASAKNNFQLEELNLYISSVVVNEGPTLKRYRPRARGRAFPIQKKTSHITVVLDEITPTGDTGRKKKKDTAANAAADSAEPKAERAARTKFRAAKDMAKPKQEGGSKRIFRRKAI